LSRLVEHCHEKFLCFIEFTEDEKFYIITEYLDRYTPVASVMALLKPLIKIKIIQNIVGNVVELHDMKIIHSDLAPTNIMTTSNGEIKIIDFGQSCYVDKCNKVLGSKTKHLNR